ncbi:MAG: adenylate/guanylate cyclase domain-containing protein, partial [Granulosicoccus sp.]
MPDISSWLAELGLDKYIPAFAEAEINYETLPDLAEEDLKEIGLPLGPRRRVWGAIQRLGGAHPISDEQVAAAVPSPTLSISTTQSDAERRHLTVMFVDLVGSTEMATRMDPEDMRHVITNYQNTIAGIVSRFDGFIAKFMGDGVLCYFGWPRANEDDAERAVRAGLAMITSISKTADPRGTPLSTRVGIATGVVVVGDMIGSGASQEAAVVGETPNLAARLQGLAQPDQLVLPKQTQSLLGNIFQLESIGDHNLKGIAKPVKAYVVIGENSRESRFAARQKGALTPIVGREQELGLLREYWTKAKSGTGQMIIVSGEAGIGKSRIAQAAIDEVAQDDHIRLTYQCSPYHADSAFYPVIQQISFAARFISTDGPDAKLDKLEELLGNDQEILRLMASMLGLDGEARYGKPESTPAQQRAQTMQMFTRLLIEQAQQKPVLLIYEDLHWIDPTSLELLETLLDALTNHKIMILATARPTFEYGFGGHPMVTRFALNRLTREQITTITSKLTGGKSLPDEIVDIICQRTDGVPLFVEELTKTILESGALREEGAEFILNGSLSTIAIPTTLHDSLMARLDRLQPIKEVAQTASCIGREFGHGLLAIIAQLPDDKLDLALTGLIDAELIYRRGVPPEATYLFKHALVRDAAYESLLKEKRRAIHTSILNTLETDKDIAPEVLAVHAEAAGLTDQAIDLWGSASKAAIARPAFDEAIAHIRRAIDLLKPEVENNDFDALNKTLTLQVQLSVVYMSGKGWAADATKAAFQTALTLADKIGETPMRFSILYGLMVVRYARGEMTEAVRHGQSFVDLAEASQNTAPACVANRSYAAAMLMSGDFGSAQPYFERAVELFDPEKHKNLANQFGQDLGTATHSLFAVQLLIRGKTQAAKKNLETSEAFCNACDSIVSKCYMHLMGDIHSLISGNTHELARHSKA